MPEETSTAVAEEKFTVTLPDFTDEDAIDQFITMLQDHTDVHGVKRLLARINKHQMHLALANALMDGIKSTANYINGIRTKAERKGDGKRSLRSKATAFYNTLSTPILRMQCTAFGLDYDSFDTVDEVVTALVNKTIEQAAA